jgi:glycosyltransferase involved in cell wall biosynthesis
VKPLRVLWTLPYLPWPVTSGGKARQFNLIREMAARGHRLTLLIQSKTPADEATMRVLRALAEDVIVLPRRPLRHPLTLWRAATSPLPLLTTVNGHSPPLSERFETLLKQQPWDVVQVEHSYGFQPFEQALRRHRQPFVLTEHNVESELGAATYGKWPTWMRGLAALDQLRARRWERHALAQATAVVAVTDSDARKLAAIGGRPTHVVSNGVDAKAFAAVRPDPSSNAVLFVGNYEYAPNIDAVEWAMSEVAPRIWAQAPEARLRICGHGLPDHWAQRFPDPRIEWLGYVPDLTEVQATSAVFMAPLRFGGGSKLKVLEAMAAGLPIVSTREGLSGLPVTDGQEARVADSAADMAAAIVQTLRQPDAARLMGEAARRLVQSGFDWPSVAEQLERVHASVASRSAQER